MRRALLMLLALVSTAGVLRAEEQSFPAPEFRTGYEMPQLVVSRPHAAAWTYIDIALLAGALGTAVWLVHRKRSRSGVLALTIVSLLYFGFFRKGCICPIGSIQNVALSAGGHGYALPLAAAAFFTLPLLATLFYGRVFCSSVCPLGAIQDLVLWRPVSVPGWLEHGLGLLAYAYLGLAVVLAFFNTDFLICRYDPFVGFFRLSGPTSMLLFGAGLLALSMFVGRTYCRFLCPYGVLLRLLSPFATRRVTITPDECVDCRLCETSCPFGAIRRPSSKELVRPGGGGRRQLIAAIVALPLLVGAFAWVGHRSAHLLARRDFTVKLAERVYLEDQGAVQGVTDESTAFREKGLPVETLYKDAKAVQRRYAIGGSAFGAWMGAVIGFKIIALIVRRRRTGYTADPGGCVACARCYLSCPVEHERREEARSEEAVAVGAA